MRVRTKISFFAFTNKQTVIEFLLARIFKSFAKIAQLKSQELGDDDDLIEVLKGNNVIFKQMISGSVTNIFHKVMELHADTLKSKMSKQTYERIKYIGMVQSSQKAYEKELVEVKDKFGILKIKEVDKNGAGKATQLRSLFQQARAKDMFTNASLNSKSQDAAAGGAQTENQEDEY